MKLSFCTLALSFFSVIAHSQEYIPKAADIKHFSQTKTMVVLEDNPMCEYNLTLQDLIPVEWIATPRDFISWKNFETQKKDRNLSFLILNKVRFEKDKSNARYLFMSLLLGGNAKGLSDMPDMCSVPLAYYGAPEETYIYKIATIRNQGLQFFSRNITELYRKERDCRHQEYVLCAYIC